LREKQLRDTIAREHRAKAAAASVEAAAVATAERDRKLADEADRAAVAAKAKAKAKADVLAQAALRKIPTAEGPAVQRSESVSLEDEVSHRRAKTPRSSFASTPIVESASSNAAKSEDDIEDVDIGADFASKSSRGRGDGGGHSDSDRDPTSDIYRGQKGKNIGTMSSAEDDGEGGELVRIKSELPRRECGHAGGNGSCPSCEVLEFKVRGLEEQLAVLRGVVEMSGHEAGAPAKKTNSWRSKMLNVYNGNSGGVSANERARLREEVEALRKATDFLFAKLQEADQHPVSPAHEQEAAQFQLD
jgi:hypothetical protein